MSNKHTSSDEPFVGCCSTGIRHEICSHVKAYIKTNYILKADVVEAIGENEEYKTDEAGWGADIENVSKTNRNKLRAQIKESLNLEGEK